MQSQTSSTLTPETGVDSQNDMNGVEENVFETLDPRLTKAVRKLGYKTPTQIQAMAIPPLLEGRDVIGQAQTGTGKTAAFALPLLSALEPGRKPVQILVLAPTRELAIQVSEAMGDFASELGRVTALPIYGGADIRGQLTALKRSPQIVVGTPGRVMDHMRRGTLDLSELTALVLDEADEMLRMGFIDDVKWILEQTPDHCQKALFSATMHEEIRKIARQHLTAAVEVTVKQKTTTAATIEQRYWEVQGLHKLDALTRMLEAEERDGVLIFAKTKASTVKLADQLEQRGFVATPLNGDMQQSKREQTVDRFRQGRIEILVATDVAARGLDVDRISHVINYDMPHDSEAYVHRIGRTGRAGRTGQAILFVSRRERGMLKSIERATRQSIKPYVVPTQAEIIGKRLEGFKHELVKSLKSDDLNMFRRAVAEVQQETNADPLEIAAAVASMMPGLLPGSPLPLPKTRHDASAERGRGDRQERPSSRRNDERSERSSRSSGDTDKNFRERKRAKKVEEKSGDWIDAQMERYRVEVGYEHGVQPSNLVGAIANESGLESKYIGRIVINDDHSTIDLPVGMPKQILSHLKSVWVVGQQLQLARTGESGGRPSGKGNGAPARGPRRKQMEDSKPRSKKHTMRRKSA